MASITRLLWESSSSPIEPRKKGPDKTPPPWREPQADDEYRQEVWVKFPAEYRERLLASPMRQAYRELPRETVLKFITHTNARERALHQGAQGSHSAGQRPVQKAIEGTSTTNKEGAREAQAGSKTRQDNSENNRTVARLQRVQNQDRSRKESRRTLRRR